MEPVTITASQLAEILQSLGARAVITKNNVPDLEGNYRLRPGYPLDMLDGYWQGRPDRISAGGGYAIHLVEHRKRVWLGVYRDLQQDGADERVSLVVGNAQCFEVTDLNLGDARQQDLRVIFRQRGAVTYSYFTPDPDPDKLSDGMAQATELLEPPEERERGRELRLEAYRRNSAQVRYLKTFYSGRCQLCGSNALNGQFGELSEGHHIEWLCRGGVDEKENIMILCPNHHAAIHQVDPRFNREALVFQHGSAAIPVQLDQHLRPKRPS